jgi:hypothetical protein
MDALLRPLLGQQVCQHAEERAAVMPGLLAGDPNGRGRSSVQAPAEPYDVPRLAAAAEVDPHNQRVVIEYRHLALLCVADAVLIDELQMERTKRSACAW